MLPVTPSADAILRPTPHQTQSGQKEPVWGPKVLGLIPEAGSTRGPREGPKVPALTPEASSSSDWTDRQDGDILSASLSPPRQSDRPKLLVDLQEGCASIYPGL